MHKSEFFSETETGCRCGKCGKAQGMTNNTIKLFDALRETCGFPLHMSSGYRCPLHHDNPGGAHGDGEAGDIKVDRQRAFRVLENALILGFTGIGVKQKGANRFIHLDISSNSDKLRPVIWSY